MKGVTLGKNGRWYLKINGVSYGSYATEDDAIDKARYLISLNPLLAEAIKWKKGIHKNG